MAGIVVLALLLCIVAAVFAHQYLRMSRKVSALKESTSVINMVHGRRISSGQLETNLDQYVRFAAVVLSATDMAASQLARTFSRLPFCPAYFWTGC